MKRNSQAIIAPSLLSAPLADLRPTVEMLNESEAEWIHIDVMDGHFVPNLTFGMPIVKAIRPLTNKVLDVHLMIEKPERYFEAFQQAGADVLTIHFEACTHLNRSLTQIRELGMKAGLALNPHTSPELISEVMENVDLILVMSVNPGFGGQKFIPRTLPKLRRLAELNAIIKNSKVILEVDGGVDKQNAYELKNSGADVLVAGNAVFGHSNPMQAIADLKTASGKKV